MSPIVGGPEFRSRAPKWHLKAASTKSPKACSIPAKPPPGGGVMVGSGLRGHHLSFDGAQGDAADNPLLEDDVDDQHRQ